MVSLALPLPPRQSRVLALALLALALALAIALRLDCPIFVDDEVLKSSKLAASMSERVSSEELRKWLEGLNDEDLGRYKM